MADSIFEQFKTPYWRGKGKAKVFLPLHNCRQSKRRGLGKHKRLNKSGERIDNLGAYSDVFNLTLEYYNSQEHPEAKGLYPDDIEALEEAFEPNDQGELFLPQFGIIPAQFESLERVETNEQLDYCAVQCVFIRDFADDDEASRWKAPSASTVAQGAVESYKASAFEEGIDPDPLGELQDFGAELEGLASAPADYANAIDGKITQATATIKRVEETFANQASSARSEVYSSISDPAGSRVGRKAKALADIIGAARNEVYSGGIVTKVYPNDVSIFFVANDVKQEVEKLVAINSKLDNLMRIVRGTPIRVFTT